jgi:hypothetical protein
VESFPLADAISRRTSTGFTESHTYILDTGIEGNHSQLTDSLGNEHYSAITDAVCSGYT